MLLAEQIGSNSQDLNAMQHKLGVYVKPAHH